MTTSATPNTYNDGAKLTNPGLQCYIPLAKHFGAIVLASFSQWRDRAADAAQQGPRPAIHQKAYWQHLPAATGQVLFCVRGEGPWRLRPT